MNWYKKAQENKSQFSQLDSAYKKGIKAKKEGKLLSDNPYPPLPQKGSRSHSPYSSWIRGWLAGR